MGVDYALHGMLPRWLPADILSTVYTVTLVTILASVGLTIFRRFVSLQNHQQSAKHESGPSPPQLLWPTKLIKQNFFETQFDFLAEGFRTTASKTFRFQLMKNEVTAVSGDDARRTFFKEKSLNLYEGFQVLIGTIPTGLDTGVLHGIYKRLNLLQKPDSLQRLLPQLLSDCHTKMKAWGTMVVDPCSDIHEVTFQMIIRAVTSYEVAENAKLVSDLKYAYDVIDSSIKPVSSNSWIPGLATIRRLRASLLVYWTFKSAVTKRIRTGVRQDDTLQQLVDSGESPQCMVGFMMGLPIAGARSTGTIGTWILLFLAHDDTWRNLVRKEIKAMITSYGQLPETSSPETTLDALSTIPLAAWETQIPSIDLCIKETLRRAQPHTAVRRNTGADISIGTYTIPAGGFVLYPFSDNALNPELYPDPARWNPDRKFESDTFLGWGGGNHMCKGQRLATLTMKLVVAYVLMSYDISLVDSQGNSINDAPVPDWNDFLTCRPKGDCLLRFSERSSGEDMGVDTLVDEKTAIGDR